MRNKKANSTTRTTLAILMLMAVMLGGAITACSSANEAEDLTSERSEGGEHGGEGRESGEHGGEGGEEGEESGNTLTLDETYDTVRKGTRLIMNYDAASNSFVGTVENTTEGTLPAVRVEVHLSNGIELGPTTRVDLPAGETIEVTLPASDKAFDGWTPHAEVGSSEGGHGEGDQEREDDEDGEEREDGD